LSILIILDCKEISEDSYKTSNFKIHKYLKLLCVTYNREALSPSCVIELLKYNNSQILLDIRGNDLTDTEFDEITEDHPDTLSRIKDVEDYQQSFVEDIFGKRHVETFKKGNKLITNTLAFCSVTPVLSKRVSPTPILVKKSP
jgi:fructose-1,6-bisphosphatase